MTRRDGQSGLGIVPLIPSASAWREAVSVRVTRKRSCSRSDCCILRCSLVKTCVAIAVWQAPELEPGVSDHYTFGIPFNILSYARLPRSVSFVKVTI